ncbi:MerR family transcriptional regulator [Pseudoponticoccus marisrubri]|uniref:MerR family transcriptional regulator n=1 Tax=Pseudoponticoccus marisrubri TaxID=1685382 RepID=UPI000AB0DC0E|nr:MerR family transcriptional regulator [Pseudoponticoccus marisrubri]
MPKSPDAFRTISEVAEWLETPAHVLRFWESKFTQVKPVKRAGGRRYYRPADMELLGGIKKLLHDDGMTIKGVQKILREQGVRHVSALSQMSVDGEASDKPREGELIEDAPYAEVEIDETAHGAVVAFPGETRTAPQEIPQDMATEDSVTGQSDETPEETPAEAVPDKAKPEDAASVEDETVTAADETSEPAAEEGPAEAMAEVASDAPTETATGEDPAPAEQPAEAAASESDGESDGAPAETDPETPAEIVVSLPEPAEFPAHGPLTLLARLDRVPPEKARALAARLPDLRAQVERLSAPLSR